MEPHYRRLKQELIDLEAFSRWEIAKARDQTVREFALPIAMLAGLAIDRFFHFWPMTLAVFIGVLFYVSLSEDKAVKAAWANYMQRRQLPTDEDSPS